MTVPAAFDRGANLAAMLLRGRKVTTALIREQFGVSRAQAKRDLLALEVLTQAEAEVAEDRQVTLRVKPSRKD